MFEDLGVFFEDLRITGKTIGLPVFIVQNRSYLFYLKGDFVIWFSVIQGGSIKKKNTMYFLGGVHIRMGFVEQKR